MKRGLNIVTINMKIAVLLYAQPRFLNLTYERIREEYNIPEFEVDFFLVLAETMAGFDPYARPQ